MIHGCWVGVKVYNGIPLVSPLIAQRFGKQFRVNISNFEDLRGDCYSVNLKSIFRNLLHRRRPPGV